MEIPTYAGGYEHTTIPTTVGGEAYLLHAHLKKRHTLMNISYLPDQFSHSDYRGLFSWVPM